MALFPKNLTEYVASMGIPLGPLSKVFLVDPVNGSDSNPGTNWKQPLKTLTAAEDLCTGDRHDTVLFLSGDTADNPAAAIVWDKDYTHLIGLSSPLYGVGQRCRVVATGSAAISPIITFSGNGCIVKNMQFMQEKAAGAASGAVIVTGSRCYFENVFFATPKATDAASYSLKVSGSENVFKRCTIGQHTYVRTGASYGLWMFGTNPTRNKFVDCEFLSWSSVTTHVLAYHDVSINGETFVIQYENCLWDNLNGSGEAGAVLAVAIDDNCATANHQVILRGQNDFLKCTAVADPLTYVYAHDPEDTVSGCLMIAVAES